MSLWFFYLLAVASPLSIAAINVALGGLTLFFIVRILTGRWKPGLPAVLLIVFFAWNAVCALLSPLRADALAGVFNYWSWTALLTATAIPWAVRKNVARFSGFLAVSVLLTVPMSLLEFLFGTDIFHHQAFSQPVPVGSLNAYGFFSHHLTYAGSMTICGLFLAGRLLYARDRERPLQYVGLASAAAGVFTSLARTYYLAVLPGLAVLLWSKGRRRVLQVSAALVLALVLAACLGPARVRARFTSLWDMNNASNAERIYLWIAGLHMWEDRPIVGWGPGTYEKVADPYKAPYASLIHYPDHVGFLTRSHSHNLFLMVALQSGAVGLLIFLAFVAAAYRGMMRQADLALRYGAMAAFTAFLVGGLFEYNGGDAEVATLLFFLVGLSLANSEQGMG